jgi:SSS family solute:Na+ symporter
VEENCKENDLPNLAPVDLMILLIYFFFVISVGVGLKQSMTGSTEFLLAGRKLPGWLCGLAFAGAGAGSLELLSMGAAGARYGLVSATFFGLGAVVPLLFSALYLVPAYYASRAKSLPDYLRLRFDEKTRVMAVGIMLAGLLASAALALYVMARVSASLRLFDAMFHLQHVNMQGQLGLAVAIPAAIVLIYVALGGLGATMYAQVMQFFMLLAGFLPMVLLGLKQVGDWSGMKVAFAAAVAGSGGVAAGGSAMGTALLLGILLTAGTACTDMSLLQTALVAENGRAAQKAGLTAAAWKAVLPFLLIVPGVIAVGLPTPHTSISVRNENGEIFHSISVVPHAVDEGLGAVPARTDSIADPMAGNVLKDGAGNAMIDYSLATPFLLPRNLPTGLLGLGLAALLACLTGGVASRIAAINTVIVYDVYLGIAGKQKPEKHLLAVSRLTTLGAVVIAALMAWVALRLNSMPDLMDILAVLLAVAFAPMLGTFVLGALWRGATNTGAFAGLLSGLAAGLVHWGITLPAGYARGFAGGWLRAVHHPANMLAQNAGTAALAILANAGITMAVSLMSAPKKEPELAALVYTASPSKEKAWWRRPAGAATLILALAIVVSLIFA